MYYFTQVQCFIIQKKATNRTELRSDAQRAGTNFLLTLVEVRFVEDTLFLLDRSICSTHLQAGDGLISWTLTVLEYEMWFILKYTVVTSPPCKLKLLPVDSLKQDGNSLLGEETVPVQYCLSLGGSDLQVCFQLMARIPAAYSHVDVI